MGIPLVQNVCDHAEWSRVSDSPTLLRRRLAARPRVAVARLRHALDGRGVRALARFLHGEELTGFGVAPAQTGLALLAHCESPNAEGPVGVHVVGRPRPS